MKKPDPLMEPGSAKSVLWTVESVAAAAAAFAVASASAAAALLLLGVGGEVDAEAERDGGVGLAQDGEHLIRGLFAALE